jgi:hypothetical protein
MIFICEERVLNGTVTINSMTSGINTDSFALAKKIFKHYLVKMKSNVIYLDDSDKLLTWEVINTNGLRVIGRMENKNLYMIGEFND